LTNLRCISNSPTSLIFFPATPLSPHERLSVHLTQKANPKQLTKFSFALSLLFFTISVLDAQPTKLTDTVRVSYWEGDSAPDYGVEYHYYKTNSKLVFLDNEERSLNDYIWNSSTGRLTDISFDEYFDYTYSTASEGTGLFSDGDTGTFAVYDASWDLDFDGTPDGEQIEAGVLPTYSHKQLGFANTDTSSFWVSNEGASADDLSLTFSAQQIDVIASGNSPWGIVNALRVTNSGEINSLSWDNDWTVDVTMLNSVTVTNGGTFVDADGEDEAVNQAVMWLDLVTTTASANDDPDFLYIALQDHNGVKQIVVESDLADSDHAVAYSPVEDVHIRLSYDSTAAELTSAYSYDGDLYTELCTSSVASSSSYINGDPLSVALGAESDNVQINLGENTFKGFVVSSDRDGDGLDDSVETNTGIYVSETDTGSDPNNSDSDNDTILDGIEVRHATFGFDPTVSSASRLLDFQQAAAELPGVLTDAQRQSLSLGGVSLTPSVGGGFSFEFVIEESENLSDWTTVDTINHLLKDSGTKRFIRVRMPE
jgi:hypothetical protein